MNPLYLPLYFSFKPKKIKSAFWTCNRFSLCEKMSEQGVSGKDMDTSLPRSIGMQCIKTASGFAWDIKDSFTWNPWKSFAGWTKYAITVKSKKGRQYGRRALSSSLSRFRIEIEEKCWWLYMGYKDSFECCLACLGSFDWCLVTFHSLHIK